MPHGRWRTLTFIAALRVDGIGAPCMDEVRGSGSAELQEDGTIDIECACHHRDDANLTVEHVTSSTAC